MAQYKLVHDLLKIPIDDHDDCLYVEVPCDTLVDASTRAETPELTEFEYSGRAVTTFTCDLEANAELVEH
jgi:hypothetical protein